MSLLALVYQLVPDSPILVAANRDETLDRSCPNPTIQSGKPRILASFDPKTKGTYLGVNQRGMMAAAIPRKKFGSAIGTKSRSLLCREMLKCSSARAAVDMAVAQLHTDQYDGVNLVVADSESGWVVHSSTQTEVVELNPGLNIIGNYNLDDPRDGRVGLARRMLTLQTLDSPVKFLALASKVFARGATEPGRPSMVVRDSGYGTISSTLIALGKKPRDAIYQYAAGSPDVVRYEDFSPFLRDILSRGLRENRMRATNT
ncbi:MAG: NRDE family protein [Planctomycetaceae bacterium]|nr:NRDE family protein [Planctomycetaceae bacterium]